MSRHKSGCCGGNKNHEHEGSHSKGCKHCGGREGSHSKGCKHCGRKPPPPPTGRTQFKFSGTTRVVTDQTVVTSYLADPGTAATAEANLQSYPIALTQDITTLSCNVLTTIPPGEKLEVEVLRDGVSLPIPLKVTYLPGQSGLMFVVAAPQTFNGAGAPSSSRLDVATTGTLLVGQTPTVSPIQLTAVVG